MRLLIAPEGFSMPVGFEACDNFGDFVSMGSNDRVISCFGYVLCLPIERLHVGGRVINDHRLLVSDVVLRVAIENLDASSRKRFVRLLVFRFAVAAGGIQHDPDVNATFLSVKHSL